MLKASERFSRVSGAPPRGKKHAFAFGMVLVFPQTPARAAVVAPKKIFKTAVVRNRVRRRMYSILRPLIRSRLLSQSVIVYPNKIAATAPFSEIASTLSAVLARVH